MLVLDLADDLLDQVLQGDQARRAPVFVQDDDHLGPFCAHFLDQFLDRLRCRSETHRPRDGPNLFLAPVTGGPPQVPGEQDSHDLVEVPLVHGQAQLAVVQHDVHGLAHRRVHRHGDDVDPWRHDLAHRDLVELHDIGHDLELVLVERALAVPELRERLDLGPADLGALMPPRRDPSAEEVERRQDRLHHEDHQAQQVRGGARELVAERGPERLRDDLRVDQHGEGEHRGERPDPHLTEDLCGDGAPPGRTHSVRDGVQRQDRGDGFVDPVLHPAQDPAGHLAAALHQRDIAAVDRQEHGLEDRAHERNRQRDADHGEQLDHDRTPHGEPRGLALAARLSLPFGIDACPCFPLDGDAR